MTGPDEAARRRALDRIVRLARSHGLSAGDIAAALAGAESLEGPPSGGLLARSASYLGGLFVFAGIVTFVGLNWDHLNGPARVAITLGPGLAALALALLAQRSDGYARAAAPLYLIAAALEPGGMLIAFEEFGGGGDWRHAGLITAGTLTVQMVLVHRARPHAVARLLAMLFAVAAEVVALDLVPGLPAAWVALTVAASTLCLGLHLRRRADDGGAALFLFAGSAGALGALFALIEGTPLEVAFPLAPVGLLYLSLRLRSRVLLLNSVVGLLAFVGYYTAEYFADSLGWPLALVAFGLALIALGGLGLRLDRRYLRT